MAFDVFLKIATIPGESTDDKHADWIEVLSFEHGVDQPTAGSRSSGGAATGQRVNHRDFRIVHALDKASPKLALACCKGEHIKEVLVQLCRATGDKTQYMEYKMADVIVTQVVPIGDAAGEELLPLETVTFNYGKITWTYTETDHDTGDKKGDISTWWSPAQNKGG
jgi:type VI secretion system secreted protein Hcp